MTVRIVVHEAPEGGCRGEVPSLPGCASQGETMEELRHNLQEAMEGRLSIDLAGPQPGGAEHMLDIAS